MLWEGKPDLVAALPSSNGTLRICSMAEQAGIPVLRIDAPQKY